LNDRSFLLLDAVKIAELQAGLQLRHHLAYVD
jgi:hypothetical protein